MPTEEQPSDELVPNGTELEELEILLEADDQPSTVQIFSIPSSPNPSPLQLLPFIFPTTAGQSIQSDEHEPTRPRKGVTLVIWDPRLPGSFLPASHTSILLAWWHSQACYGTFGAATYRRLSEPVAIAGKFDRGDLQSDDMEGMPIWDPTVPETIQELMC